MRTKPSLADATLLLVGFVLSLLVTMVVLPSADAIAAWGKQHPTTIFGLDAMAMIVALAVVLPPALLLAFCLRLLVLLGASLLFAFGNRD
jgi:hypothetical protein